MNILIDNQYESIYCGEFKSWFELNIINRLQGHNIDFSKNIDESSFLLNSNQYDLVFITGYDWRILGLIDDKKQKAKVVSIIYDMNAEQLIEYVNDDSGYLADIITAKSKLIFLSSKIICTTKETHNNIIELYGHFQHGNIKEKIIDIDFLYKLFKNDEKPSRVISGKYVVIKESINGVTFATPEFEELLNNIMSRTDYPDNFYFTIISNSFPSKLWNKIKNAGFTPLFKILKDVDENEIISIYANSIAVLFVSSLDTNLSELCKAICANSLCLINEENTVFKEFMGSSGVYFILNKKYSLLDDIREIMRTSSEILSQIKLEQRNKIQKTIESSSLSLNINV